MTSYGGHICDREGPAGRRAALVGGPDAWEVVTTEPEVRDREQRIVAVAESLALGVEQVAAALDYYDDHRREVDAWVAENTRVAHEARRRARQRELLAAGGGHGQAALEARSRLEFDPLADS